MKLLNMSIAAGWMILAVLLVRIIFRKMPKWISCLLWGIVAIRLVCPVLVESPISLVPATETFQTSTYIPVMDSDLTIVENTINPILKDTFSYDESESISPIQVVTYAAGMIWCIGMVLMLLYVVVSSLRIHRMVREAVCCKGNIYLCDAVKSPFILGLISPRIYLPSGLAEEEMHYIVAHEEAHLRRKDYWWKPLGYLLLSIYWFQPLCWVAYILLCKDIELACDEKVIRNLTFSEKKDYSKVLVACGQQRKVVMACPLAFGEVGVKERVKSVLHYKKPTFWILIVAILTCIIIAACFLTNPPKESENSEVAQENHAAISEDTEQHAVSLPDASGEVHEEDLNLENSDNVYSTDMEDEVYRNLVMEMLDTGTFPATGGTPYNGMPYENTYAVMDIDDDGKEELLINFGNAHSMAGMVLYIYDYNRTTGEVYVEYAGFPGMTVYDNGYIKEEASHNHGRSALEDFWPYALLKYDVETDTYEQVANIDAWQRTISEDSEPDPEFPREKDLDGDGIVYYDISISYYEPTMIMDNAEYEKWCEQYNTGNQKEIKWHPIITREEYDEMHPSTAVG